jgi:hypothetical protein
MPGPGTDAGAAQALGTTSVRIASLCTAGIAAGACVAAGVVPGIGAVGLLGHHHAQKTAPAARRASAVGAPPPIHLASESAPSASPGAGSRRASPSAARHRALAPSGASHLSDASPQPSFSPPSARVSARQTGTEFGPESAQPTSPGAIPSTPTSPSQGSSGASVSSGAAAKSTGPPGAGGSKSAERSGSEFGM